MNIYVSPSGTTLENRSYQLERLDTVHLRLIDRLKFGKEHLSIDESEFCSQQGIFNRNNAIKKCSTLCIHSKRGSVRWLISGFLTHLFCPRMLIGRLERWYKKFFLNINVNRLFKKFRNIDCTCLERSKCGQEHFFKR